MKKPTTQIAAVLSILAGVAVLVLEIRRLRAGAGIDIWFWGLIAVLAIVFGVYELFFAPKGGDDETSR